MSFSYGRYKGLRDASWHVLMEHGIKSLPVKVISIAQAAQIKVIENLKVNELSSGQIGLSLLKKNNWCIVFDETMLATRIRFTVAHELGHIFLGHALTDGYHARQFERAAAADEREADMFAARLLAPACVLWGLNLHTPEEIMKVCDISYTAAKIRAERMAVLHQRQKFLTSPLERQVYEQFKDFIAENRQK